jgi:3-hydroxyacyl-CoA dehydrogenase/enoyl-CoA hydratase/3-hydroxybutyryl-CoA epimerase
MPDTFRHLKLDRDARGVVTVTFDVAGSPVNVFNEGVFAELSEVVSQLERDPPKLLVFRSGKPSGFFAGAEVHRIRELKSADEARAVLAAGQELFARVERLPFPTVAVIHGMCLGGGLEFALSCKYRVARDDSSTKIGLPEVQLGLIPGWGGTQRLPRVVGVRRALGMILEGSTLSAAKAAKVGLVDLAAPPETFDAEVNRFVEDRLAGRSVRRPTRGLGGMFLEGTGLGRKIVFSVAGKKAAKRGKDYPAVAAALRAIQAGFRGSRESGFAAEREEFAKVVVSPVSRNLIDIFLNREKARKRSTWVPEDVRPKPVNRVAVIGGGTMGAGIAQLLAVNGTPVVLKEINPELAAAGKERVEKLTRDAAAKGVFSSAEGEAILGRITSTADAAALAGCELAIEAVVEREDIKRSVFKDLAERLGTNAVLATNTSALSVTRIAETTPHPERVAGLHFFNPVHRMPLVEVVRGKSTDDATIATLVDLVRKLGKVPVVVADSPGFLVNRILFPYLDEAVRMILDGHDARTVDSCAKKFGMPMGPLELLDQIGLDIAADVAKTFATLTTDPGPVPARFAEMVKDGALGKKAGRGFYEYPKGEQGKPTHWGMPAKQRVIEYEKDDGSIGTVPETKVAIDPVQKRLIYPMINEAAKCLEAGIVSEAWAIDLAMVMGTGFAPFRGGPLRTADTIGVPRVGRELEAFRDQYGPRFEPCGLLKAMAAEGRGFYTEHVTAPATV